MAKKAKIKARKKAAPRPARKPATRKPAPQAAAPSFAALREIHRAFAANVPRAALSSGAFQPGDPPNAGDLPDGQYRIEGSDWVMTVDGRRVTLIERWRPDLVDLVNVPAH